MRLFIALGFSDENKDKIVAAQNVLREYDDRANYTRRENLHLTLAFLGELPGSAVGTVSRAMDAVNLPPFTLTLSGIGRFRRGGDVWWQGVRKNAELTALHASLTASLRECGVAFDGRSFSPHMTLAREVRIPDEAANVLLTRKTPEITQPVNAVSLFKSERINGKLVYTEIYAKTL